ncbi:MAG: TerB N-terminal domain-containing protein [Eubacteriales bacterium]
MADKRDDFWDIGMLLPERKLRPYVPGDISMCELEVGTDEEQPKNAAIPARKESSSDAYSYSPENGSIKSVRIEQWQSKYSLYSDFAAQAKAMAEKKSAGAEYVYFFSYRAQYSEMNSEQAAWYLTWREAVREGKYPKTGLSYILLYVHELIHLSDVMEPCDILERLIRLWTNYRESFSRLDKYLSEWVADFALIHRLKPDLSLLEPFLGDIMSNTTLKEFYFDLESCIREGRITQLMSLTSGYNYKDSKFYIDENIPLFDTHVPEMLRLMLNDGSVSSYISQLNVITSNVTREAFTGAVCAFHYKKRIFCSIYSYLRSYDFKQLITGAVKYAENAIRAYLGIKSRLYQIELAQEARAVLDAYIKRNLTRRTVSDKKAPVQDDEAPPPQREVSVDLSAAASIEKESWDTTRKLVELQAEDGAPSPAAMYYIPEEEPAQELPTEDESHFEPDSDSSQSDNGLDTLLRRLDGDELDFLRAALVHDDTDRSRRTVAVASRCKSMPEMLIERINDKSLEVFGDILIDMSASAVLEDYCLSVKEILDEQ